MQDAISRVAKALGVPVPPDLKRAEQLEPVGFLKGNHVAYWPVPGAQATANVLKTLTHAQATILAPPHTASGEEMGIKPLFLHQDGQSQKVDALIFDATSDTFSTTELAQLHDFFHPMIRSINRNGRVIVIGKHITAAMTPSQAAAQRALEGFMRSAAKEINKRGCSAQLLYVDPTLDNNPLEGSLRFFLSPRSAYITSQMLELNTGFDAPITELDWSRPLNDKVALVTGASRGIGKATAERLAAYGAKVVCLDLPSQSSALTALAKQLGGLSIEVDITTASAPEMIASFLEEHTQGVDVVVHNAGITRDRTMGRMSRQWWEMCMEVNLLAVERITARLLQGTIREHGSIICLSSIAGIAGNMGQTNYASAKAGLRGFVKQLGQHATLQNKHITVNAIAPGFIETDMTEHMPLMIREVAKRLNSFNQGGVPDDVAQAIAYMASPAQFALTGQTLRVCGGMLIGA